MNRWRVFTSTISKLYGFYCLQLVRLLASTDTQKKVATSATICRCIPYSTAGLMVGTGMHGIYLFASHTFS